MEHSPLYELPPELRNLIYEHILITSDPFIIRHKYRRDYSLNVPFHGSPRLALGATCKQINKECMPVFYGGNSFAVYSCDGNPESFLSTIGPRIASRLGTFVLRVGVGTWEGTDKNTRYTPFLASAEDLWHASRAYGLSNVRVEVDFSEMHYHTVMSLDPMELDQKWDESEEYLDELVKDALDRNLPLYPRHILIVKEGLRACRKTLEELNDREGNSKAHLGTDSSNDITHSEAVDRLGRPSTSRQWVAGIARKLANICVGRKVSD